MALIRVKGPQVGPNLSKRAFTRKGRVSQNRHYKALDLFGFNVTESDESSCGAIFHALDWHRYG